MLSAYRRGIEDSLGDLWYRPLSGQRDPWQDLQDTHYQEKEVRKFVDRMQLVKLMLTNVVAVNQ